MKQLGFAGASSEFKDYWKATGRTVHGGLHAQGKRKTKRPLSTKKPIHVVMRSSLANGNLSLRNFAPEIKVILEKFAKRFQVRIYQYSNNSNHLHLLVRAKEKRDLQRFFKTVLGLIARLVLNAKKGRSSKILFENGGRFWDHLVFTRVAHWGKAFGNLKAYVIQNILEAAGVLPYKPRRLRGPAG